MSGSVLDIQPETGIFSPRRGGNTQVAAAFRMERVTVLACGADDATVELFVMMPFPHGAETRRLNCYPSPDGRSCTLSCRPSIFSCKFGILQSNVHARKAAEHGHSHGVCFDASDRLSQVFQTTTLETQQGRDTCDSDLSRSWRVWGFGALRPAAKVCLSRRFWGPARGRARRRCSMAASVPARLWVRRATWPIARPIRAAVAELSRPAHPVRGQRLI